MSNSQSPHVLLINPPVYDFALYDLFYRPYGLIRIGRWLEHSGYKISIIDCLDPYDTLSSSKLGSPKRNNNGTGKFFRERIQFPGDIIPKRKGFARYGIVPESLKKKLFEITPDIVLVTTGMTYWYVGVKEVIETVKSVYNHITVLAGGVYASVMPDHCRDICGADYVVKGNGEEYISNIFNLLGFGKPDAFEMDRLGAVPGSLENKKLWRGAGVIRLNNGCPLSCDYCASKRICNGFEKGNPEKTALEIIELHEKYNLTSFAFYDDALLVSKEGVIKPFLELIIQTGKKFNFYTPNAVHMEFLDAETCTLMKKAGFKEIRLGLESAEQQFHDEYDNKLGVEHFSRVLQMLRKAGFGEHEIMIYVLAGLPGQNADKVKKTVEYAGPKGAAVHIAEYSPIPGTVLYDKSCKLSRYPLDKDPLYHNNSLFPMEWEGFTAEDLSEIKKLSRAYR